MFPHRSQIRSQMLSISRLFWFLQIATKIAESTLKVIIKSENKSFATKFLNVEEVIDSFAKYC